MKNEDYNTLEWLSEDEKPSKEFLDLEIEKMIVEKKILLCKSDAKQLIAKYDFAVLPDRSKDIENINEIISYRDTLLSLIKNPIENPEFPTPPEVIWKS